MSIFSRFKEKDWLEGRIQSVQKNKKITTLTILILISGFFFYIQLLTIFPKCFANDYESEGYLENEREWIAKIGYIKSVVEKQEEKQNKFHSIDTRRLKINKTAKRENDSQFNVQEQIYNLVGDSPIKEMVPSIIKLDQKVAAFVIGIAKKESNWGKHAPSQGGRTCYNYWGYKGSGSRGTSMGYACFSSPEEAVEVVGRRIGALVSKNINNPKEMLVWKCGSSCAGHDPGGVQKWISDVDLYFGKVMQIQKI